MTSLPCDQLRQRAPHWAGGDKEAESPGLFSSGERNRTLTAFKKIGVSARRALKLVSRSIDHRGAARSASADDDSGTSKSAGDESPKTPITTLSRQLCSKSYHVHQSVSLPCRRQSTELSDESPRKRDARSPRLHSGLSSQSVQSPSPWQSPPPQQQQQQQQQRPQVASPPAESAQAPPTKPRSLLSALLKRSPSGTSPVSDGGAGRNKDAISVGPSTAPPLLKLPQPKAAISPSMASPVASCSGRAIPSGYVPHVGYAPQQGTPPGLGPAEHGACEPCSYERMYESLPSQQDRRAPVQHPLLVPQRPQRTAALPDRLNVCLSAPSPHQPVISHEHALSVSKGGDVAAGSCGTHGNHDAAAPVLGGVNVAAPRAEEPQRKIQHGSNCRTKPGGSGDIVCLPDFRINVDESLTAPSGPPTPTSVPAASLLAKSFVGRGAAVLGPALLSQPLALAAAAEELLHGAPSMLLTTSCSTPASMQRSCWTLDDYSLTKRLYKGKMSSVYKGRCLKSGLPVALKVYFKARVPANVVHMLMREISIHLEASQHKSVLKLYGVFQTDDVVVLVMELASRGCLSSICRTIPSGRLSEVQVRQTIMEPLLDALSYLHGKGVCHRDVKPENLLLTSDWGLRLADFGVSINLMEERAVTRAGTADYMAPEVQRCPLKAHADENKSDESLSYTTAADVWSVGVLAYELLVGFPPVVKEKGARATADSDLQGSDCRRATAGSELSFPASVSPAARDFITLALAQLPEERPTVRQLRCHPWMLAAAADLGRQRNIVL